jgi:hypothetical protein
VEIVNRDRRFVVTVNAGRAPPGNNMADRLLVDASRAHRFAGINSADGVLSTINNRPPDVEAHNSIIAKTARHGNRCRRSGTDSNRERVTSSSRGITANRHCSFKDSGAMETSNSKPEATVPYRLSAGSK